MDFDANIVFNFIPIISASVITFVTCLTIFLKLRNRWPAKVNCWFCNGYSKIPRQYLNWWLCNHCNQYNGFSKDGDYNYEIPEQHRVANEYKNKSFCQKKDNYKSHNKLCNKCNRREELKLVKLRELEDSMDEFNEKQMIKFEQNFERKYPLCLKCQSVVQTVLNKQKIWLMEYKMLLFKQKPLSRLIKNREKIEKILRVLLSVLASFTIYYVEAWYLPLCGIAFQLIACLASSSRGQSDLFPLLGWICLACTRSFSTTAILKLLHINFNSHWTAVDNTHQYFIITLGTAIGLLNLRTQYRKTVPNKLLSLKKLESPRNNYAVTQSCSPKPVTPQNQEIPCIKQSTKSTRGLSSPINITNSLMTPESVEMPIPLKPLNSTNSSKWSSNKTSPFEAYPTNAHCSSFSTAPDNSYPKNFGKETYSLSDSLNSLNSLSLGSHDKKFSSTGNSNHGIFETRVYGTSSPDLFCRNARYTQQRRAILAPPRLRSSQTMIETSWVAGGYWQTPATSLCDMHPSLSRSSSQSSGIGSCAGSMYGQSCEPSFHELDQCSVTSFCEQRSSRPNESTLSATPSACKRRNCLNCSVSPITLKNEFNDTVTQHQCHPKHEVQCNGHTNTIVMNSVWLPVLLCGSLVLNMLVVCTTLLR